jgi:cell shape-determining protein MreC
VPRGLVIGRVESVETQERNPFKTASVSTPVSPESLEVVAVLMP